MTTKTKSKTNKDDRDLREAVKALLEARENQMETRIEWDDLHRTYATAMGELDDPQLLMETMEIININRRATVSGTWVDGRMGGHRFHALVFPEHAKVAEYELEDSRISKLWVKRLHDGEVVANFDRGWDVRPTTPTAEMIVNLLIDGLADFVYAD